MMLGCLTGNRVGSNFYRWSGFRRKGPCCRLPWVITWYSVRLGAVASGRSSRPFDTRLNRPVALKVIHPRHVSQPDAIERLKREALAAASLDDPYICKVYELLEDGAQTMVVMEYVEGETLASRLCRGPLPVDLALRYAAEVSEALVEAHAKRVVHRDIKPWNIMITSHDHVKVMDFGIAAVSLDRTIQRRRTRPPSRSLAHPAYMAPEQAEGRRVDARADILLVRRGAAPGSWPRNRHSIATPPRLTVQPLARARVHSKLSTTSRARSNAPSGGALSGTCRSAFNPPWTCWGH